MTDSLNAYQISKRANSLRVMAGGVRWGKRGARVNTISPGIIITPLANDEFNGPRGDGTGSATCLQNDRASLHVNVNYFDRVVSVAQAIPA